MILQILMTIIHGFVSWRGLGSLNRIVSESGGILVQRKGIAARSDHWQSFLLLLGIDGTFLSHADQGRSIEGSLVLKVAPATHVDAEFPGREGNCNADVDQDLQVVHARLRN